MGFLSKNESLIRVYRVVGVLGGLLMVDKCES